MPSGLAEIAGQVTVWKSNISRSRGEVRTSLCPNASRSRLVRAALHNDHLGVEMIERDMLIELLAIKLYEHDADVDGPGWTILPEAKRAAYRERVDRAPSVHSLYSGRSLPISTPPSS